MNYEIYVVVFIINDVFRLTILLNKMRGIINIGNTYSRYSKG